MYVIQRQSDARYFAPTTNNAWRWHKDIRHAYCYSSLASAERSLSQVNQTLHLGEWLPGNKYTNPTSANIVQID